MSRFGRFVMAAILVPGLVLCATVPVNAQTCEPLYNGRLADVFYEGTAIFWQPVIEYQQMVLTIGGPCEDIVKVFGPKDEISFDVREIQRLTDGAYTWELHRVSTVDKGVQEELTAARGSGKEDALWWSFFQQGAIPEGPYVDSGSFTVVRGEIVDPNGGVEKTATVASRGAGAVASVAVAGGAAIGGVGEGSGGNTLATKDTVLTNANGVIRNSLCVGFDCANSNTYSDTTILLTENNTRIKFDDTSTLNSFPRNDWEIEANSNLNGGASYLGFNDCGQSSGGGCASDLVFAVEAGARQNALYVESDGDVGFGTSNPVVRLHTTDGDTPALRLEQDGSSGFAPQTWDVAGNETSFFIRDATNGSTLPFRIRPGASSNSLVIDADDDIGIGILSPEARLHIVGNGATRYRLENTSAATEWDTSNDGNGDFAISLVGTGGNEFEIEQSGQIGNCGNPDHDFVISTGPACTATPRSWVDAGDTGFSTSSSRAYKENFKVVDVPDILTKIGEASVYEYDFIGGPQDRMGLMAEDFHRIFERGSDKELSGHEIQLALWLAVQKLTKRTDEVQARDLQIEELKAQVEELRARDRQIGELRARLEALEAGRSGGGE